MRTAERTMVANWPMAAANHWGTRMSGIMLAAPPTVVARSVQPLPRRRASIGSSMGAKMEANCPALEMIPIIRVDSCNSVSI